jgi:hypothetical protein
MERSNKITLYHGSIYEFDKIDVTRGKPFKDFGQGFYTAVSKEHAIALAKRNSQLEKARILSHVAKGQTKVSLTDYSWLYTYELSEIAFDHLSVKRFEGPTREWMRFVSECRKSRYATHGYDMVIGPTANDSTMAVINNYWIGFYGDIGSNAAIDSLLALIEPNKLAHQYYFANQKATEYLKLTSKEKQL